MSLIVIRPHSSYASLLTRQLACPDRIHAHDGAHQQFVRIHILLQARELGHSTGRAVLRSHPSEPSEIDQAEAAASCVDHRLRGERVMLDGGERLENGELRADDRYLVRHRLLDTQPLGRWSVSG